MFLAIGKYGFFNVYYDFMVLETWSQYLTIFSWHFWFIPRYCRVLSFIFLVALPIISAAFGACFRVSKGSIYRWPDFNSLNTILDTWKKSAKIQPKISPKNYQKSVHFSSDFMINWFIFTKYLSHNQDSSL